MARFIRVKPQQDSDIIYGLTGISKYLSVSQSTLLRWIKLHGLPCGKIPTGQWMTTRSLIDQWVLSRNPYYRDAMKRRDEKHQDGQ